MENSQLSTADAELERAFEAARQRLHKDIDRHCFIADQIFKTRLVDYQDKYRIGVMERLNNRQYWNMNTHTELRYLMVDIAGMPCKDIFLSNKPGYIKIQPVLKKENWDFRWEISYDMVSILRKYGNIGITYEVICAKLGNAEFNGEWFSPANISRFDEVVGGFIRLAKHSGYKMEDLYL